MKESTGRIKWCVASLLMSILFVLATEAPDTAKRTEDTWEFIAADFVVPDQYKDDFGDFRSPLKFRDGSEVKSEEDWGKRRKEILEYWNGLMGTWPPLLTDQKFEIISSEQRENFTEHKVHFRWLPNEVTDAYLLIPQNIKGKLPAVVSVYYEPETGVGKSGELRDFAYQLAKRGFVTLSIGIRATSAAKDYSLYWPSIEYAKVQPMSMLAYAAANAWYALASRPEVDSKRIGIVGHSYGGKWAMFASCLFDKFACAAWSDRSDPLRAAGPPCQSPPLDPPRRSSPSPPEMLSCPAPP